MAKKKHNLLTKEELTEVLNNYSSSLHRIEKSIEKKNESLITKIRKYILPFISIIISGFSLFFSISIYNLGEKYKKSMNPVSFEIEFILKGKFSIHKDDPYFTFDPYNRYPITYKKDSGEVSEKYLFKYNNESKSIETIKLYSQSKDITKLNLNMTKESKAEDLQAYIFTKNKLGKFESTLKSSDLSGYKDLQKKDEILCILDPAFISPEHDYIGVYCLATIGKNDQSYLTTLITSFGNRIEQKDSFYCFDGINLFDEHKWKSMIAENPRLKSIKEQAFLTYEKSLNFLKKMR